MNAEKQLKALLGDLRSLKASYPVAGSKVKFYVTESQEYTISGRANVRLKFTPSYGRGRKVLVTLRPKVTISGSPVGFEPSVNEPQDGSGEVVLKIDFESPSATHQVKVFASGTTPGVFSVI